MHFPSAEKWWMYSWLLREKMGNKDACGAWQIGSCAQLPLCLQLNVLSIWLWLSPLKSWAVWEIIQASFLSRADLSQIESFYSQAASWKTFPQCPLYISSWEDADSCASIVELLWLNVFWGFFQYESHFFYCDGLFFLCRPSCYQR